jgi:hypothetical protein
LVGVVDTKGLRQFHKLFIKTAGALGLFGLHPGFSEVAMVVIEAGIMDVFLVKGLTTIYERHIIKLCIASQLLQY